MNTASIAVGTAPTYGNRPQLDNKTGPTTIALFLALLVGGLLFTAWSLHADMVQSGAPSTNALSYFLLGIALLIALGFEFVNGFHDTANAVATVIYTHSLKPNFAVVWSAPSTSSACWSPAAPSRSASSRCCRWS